MAASTRMAFLMVLGVFLSAPDNAEAIVVHVPATAGWVDTGVDIMVRDRLIGVGTAGQWSNSGAQPLVGPNGFDQFSQPSTIRPEANLGALLGRVGASTFLIGDAPKVRVPAVGRLFLAMNDDPATFGDNKGALDVRLAVPICKTMSNGEVRCIQAFEDGTVNLYLSPTDTVAWRGRWTESDEPEKNYCGPTAAKNLLFWYGLDAPYAELAKEMNTNDWDRLPIAGGAIVACGGHPECTAILASTIAELGVKAGTLPRDLRRVLYGPRMPKPFRGRGDDGHDAMVNIHDALADGNPVIVFESRESNNVHWAVITGFYMRDGVLWVRMADTVDRPWSEFRDDWSIKKAGNGFVDKAVEDDLTGIGLKPFMWVSWFECFPKTRCSGDEECGTESDGCGGMVSCGTCPPGQLCDQSAHTCLPCEAVCNQVCEECRARVLAKEDEKHDLQLKACEMRRQQCLKGCK